ncbi:MAG: hypothetical protein O2854_08085, partial [Chloroflexi bacterium]|nr:hypothetical protein [Chloroflexota bacterium]
MNYSSVKERRIFEVFPMRLRRHIGDTGNANKEIVFADCDVKLVDMARRSITVVTKGGKELLLTLGDAVEFTRDGLPCSIDEFLASIGMRTKVAYDATKHVVSKIYLSSAKSGIRS